MVAAGRLTVVAGASQRLRDEAVAGLRDGWTGPARRCFGSNKEVSKSE